MEGTEGEERDKGRNADCMTGREKENIQLANGLARR